MTPAVKPEWIAPDRTALVLIDCQVDFGAPEGVMAQSGADIAPAQAALARARALIDAARGAKVAVMFVRLVTRPGAESRVAREAKMRHGGEGPELCLQGTPGAAFTGVAPLPGEMVVSKAKFSAFAGTGFADALRARAIDTLVLAGLTTECCVASSAWAGFEHDFHIFIAEDACAAYAPDLHQGALEALKRSGAFVAPAGEFIRLWK